MGDNKRHGVHDNKGAHRPVTHDAPDSRPVPVTVTVDMPRGFRDPSSGPTKDVMQEAEALLALEAKATPGFWSLDPRCDGLRQPLYSELGRVDSGDGYFSNADAKFIVTLRNFMSSGGLRALMERVNESSRGLVAQKYYEGLHARIESLEAERDIYKEKWVLAKTHVPMEHLAFVVGQTDPIPPSEIAARVAQKRKERTL